MSENMNLNKDAEDNKWYGVLAYIIFFLPLIACKDSEFGKYHANQGLDLLLLSIALNIVGAFIPILGWFIWAIGNVLVIVLFIIGILHAINGEMKPLPVIGEVRLIK